MSLTLFIFRRDLRLEDNQTLFQALEHAECVIPAFIFTQRQTAAHPYFSARGFQFMVESLEELNASLQKKGGQLYFFCGEPHEIVERCIRELGVSCVAFNRDYTPYSRERDAQIAATCKSYGVPCRIGEDALIHPPEHTLKSDGTPYTVFTPYFRFASTLPISPPLSLQQGRYYQGSISGSQSASILEQLCPQREQLISPGGRTHALRRLNRLSLVGREIPAAGATSHLAAYLKFNVISVREVVQQIESVFGKGNALLRALYWRDFFTHIGFFFPHVFQGAFKKKWDRLTWDESHEKFACWTRGETGFPIVDAGMRELRATGFMHNRVRMVAGSFLVKDLHVDWRWGERYFATQLIEYDPALNNGNWQWVASTGCDAQPYFRIFNPWTQQKRFDPECLYIKKWIPELTDVPTEDIHKWNQMYSRFHVGYPKPLVEHSEEARSALARYRTPVVLDKNSSDNFGVKDY